MIRYAETGHFLYVCRLFLFTKNKRCVHDVFPLTTHARTAFSHPMLGLDPVYASVLAAFLCALGYLHYRRTQRLALQQVLQQYMPIQDPSTTQMSVLV